MLCQHLAAVHQKAAYHGGVVRERQRSGSQRQQRAPGLKRPLHAVAHTQNKLHISRIIVERKPRCGAGRWRPLAKWTGTRLQNAHSIQVRSGVEGPRVAVAELGLRKHIGLSPHNWSSSSIKDWRFGSGPNQRKNPHLRHASLLYFNPCISSTSPSPG